MSKRVISLFSVVLLMILGMVGWFASPASAHDAPPVGTAVCQTTGVGAMWEVTDGTATTENTGGAAVNVVISAFIKLEVGTPGSDIHSVLDVAVTTITQSDGHVTGDGKVITFSITDIPVDENVTVVSTTTWDGGSDTHSAQISSPSGGCIGTVDIPSLPTTLSPSCSQNSQTIIPANTASVKYLVDGQQVNGGAGGNVTTVGTHIVSAHTTIYYLFSNGQREVDWTITVRPKIPTQTKDAGYPCYMVPPWAIVQVDCVNWTIDGFDYPASPENKIVYSVDGGPEITAYFGTELHLAGGKANAWVYGKSEHSIKAIIDGAKYSDATTLCVDHVISNPPVKTKTKPKPKPMTSHSVGTAVVVHKITPAVKTNGLAVTGVSTGKLITVGAGLLLLGSLLSIMVSRKRS